MKNLTQFTQDTRFIELGENHKKIILRLDGLLEKEGYVFRAIWREALTYRIQHFIFELVVKIGRRKNLATIRPYKNGIIVEIYWGKGDNIPKGRKPKQYYSIYSENDIPKGLIEEIKELYRYMQEIEKAGEKMKVAM